SPITGVALRQDIPNYKRIHICVNLSSARFVTGGGPPCPQLYNGHGTEGRRHSLVQPAFPAAPLPMEPRSRQPPRPELAPHPRVPRGNRGKGRERHRKVNRQNFPKL